MGVLGDGSWCFCSGGGKSERVKGGIFSSKGPAMAAVSGGGTGFLIHRNLLLTTHVNLPSIAAAEAVEIRIDHGRLHARLVPHRFFITSSVLDLTIVGLDTVDADSSSQGQQLHYLRTCLKPSLELGRMVYLLGHTEEEKLMVGEGEVVIATDNLIKVSTDGVIWCPGSAGFDVEGNLAFMVCDPMKLASSPTAKSSSATSSSSTPWKKDLPLQFGIPMAIICDWLYQHWEGSLDELSKPKLPLMRLMSTGQKSEHSCASFTLRQVFKSTDRDVSLTSQMISRPRYVPGSSYSANENAGQEENLQSDVRSSHEQGIPTPEIYESPRLTSGPVRKKEPALVQLLDINFPPRAPKSNGVPLPIRQLLSNSDENDAEGIEMENMSVERNPSQEMGSVNPQVDTEIVPHCTTEGECRSEVHSSSSPLEVSGFRNEGEGFSSDGETMYSAETMESRNYPSPKQDDFQQVGRSQSCVNYSRWGSTQRNSAARKAVLQKQHSLNPPRKTHSQSGAPFHKSHDYNSPTVSSIMKKYNNSKKPTTQRQSMVQVYPRWMF